MVCKRRSPGVSLHDSDADLIFQLPIRRLDGSESNLEEYKGRVLLAVNVASKCGRTPQYHGLQLLYQRYRARGFAVLGFPCNQFNDEEPGTPDEIAEFCRMNYGVTFPLFQKIDVNGAHRHPIYEILTAHPFDDGPAGDVEWNFEKFLITTRGEVSRRFRYTTEPLDPLVVSAIDSSFE
jgi:glutathione peroxidase